MANSITGSGFGDFIDPGPGMQGPKSNNFLADPIGTGLHALGLGNPAQFDPTSQQLANLSGQQWQQAASFMYPAQNQLINYAENPDFVNQQRAQAITGADQQAATQSSAQSRILALQGINLTGPQGAAVSKQNALSKAMGEAAAGNSAAQGAAQVQNAALQGA